MKPASRTAQDSIFSTFTTAVNKDTCYELYLLFSLSYKFGEELVYQLDNSNLLFSFKVAIANANPALSCKNFFPTFMRTIPPEHFQNQGRVAMTKMFKWKRVAVLREALDTYQGLANDLVKRLKKDGVTVSLYESFEKDPELQIEALKVCE